MKFLIQKIFVPGFIFFASTCFSQHLINNTNKILFAGNDTILYRYRPLKGEGFKIAFSVKEITTMPGKLTMLNNEKMGWPGKHIYTTGTDSIILKSNKDQSFLLKATNGKDTVDIYANFVDADPNFTETYKKKHLGKVSFEIREAFELVNIILALTDSVQADDNLILKHTPYYEEVINHFKKYKQHPIINSLNREFSFSPNKIGTYYDARNWAFNYNLKENHIKPDAVYRERWGQNFWTGQTELLEDFAAKTNFDSFYRAHTAYYDSLIISERKYMPVQKMWQWLEKKFPAKYQSYRVVFSPLINGAHNTQRYSANHFSELIMFVCSTEREKEKNTKIAEGLLSGIVFTEIDHNYVNPITSKYQKSVDSIFSKREVWVSPGGDTRSYETPESVFNEYMTHSVFCLYVLDHYDPELSDFIIQKRESLMVDTRHYTKFKEFNRALIELYKQNKDQKVINLFPGILEWCKSNLK